MEMLTTSNCISEIFILNSGIFTLKIRIFLYWNVQSQADVCDFILSIEYL